MSERERWVIYPLLFLALGAALRDKLAGRTLTGSIMCEELIIMDEAPVGRQSDRALVRIGRTDGSARTPSIGYVYVNGQVEVDGKVNADSVDADRYALGGVPLRPGIQPAFLTNLFRALEQNSRASQAKRQAGADSDQSNDASPTLPSPPAEEAAPPASEASGETPGDNP